MQTVVAGVIWRCWSNQPGDALCDVSPARYAVTSSTYTKRITRLIFASVLVCWQWEVKKVAGVGSGANGCEWM